MRSPHTVVLHTILTGWTGRPACVKARTMRTIVLQSRHHGAVLTLPSLQNQRPNGFRLLDDNHGAVLTLPSLRSQPHGPALEHSNGRL